MAQGPERSSSTLQQQQRQQWPTTKLQPLHHYYIYYYHHHNYHYSYLTMTTTTTTEVLAPPFPSFKVVARGKRGGVRPPATFRSPGRPPAPPPKVLLRPPQSPCSEGLWYFAEVVLNRASLYLFVCDAGEARGLKLPEAREIRKKKLRQQLPVLPTRCMPPPVVTSFCSQVRLFEERSKPCVLLWRLWCQMVEGGKRAGVWADIGQTCCRIGGLGTFCTILLARRTCPRILTETTTATASTTTRLARPRAPGRFAAAERRTLVFCHFRYRPKINFKKLLAGTKMKVSGFGRNVLLYAGPCSEGQVCSP